MVETTHLDAGKFYHIYNRGNNREDIFVETKNYDYFLSLWQKHISPIADTYSYCLLKNHFHALVKVKELDMTTASYSPPTSNHRTPCQKGFSNFFNAYSKGFNKSYQRTGKLFEERFKRIEITNEHYFTQLIYYIHANPQQHGFIDDFRAYPYSSFNALLWNEETFLAKNQVLSWFGGIEPFKQYHADLHMSIKNRKAFKLD